MESRALFPGGVPPGLVYVGEILLPVERTGEDQHDLPETASGLERDAGADDVTFDLDPFGDPVLGHAAGIGHLEDAGDAINRSERVGSSERDAAALRAAEKQVDLVLVIVLAALGGVGERDVAFKRILRAVAGDVDRNLPLLVGVDEDRVLVPGARGRALAAHMRDGEVGEADRIDLRVELNRVARSLLLEVVQRLAGEFHRRRRGILGHHGDGAAKGGVLGRGAAHASVVGVDGTHVGVAVLLGLDHEAAGVGDTLDGLGEVGRIADDPFAGNGTGLILPAEPEGALGTRRADDLERGHAAVVIHTALEDVADGVALVEQRGLVDREAELHRRALLRQCGEGDDRKASREKSSNHEFVHVSPLAGEAERSVELLNGPMLSTLFQVKSPKSIGSLLYS